MDNIEKLKNIASIIRRGKIPCREACFFPNLNDVYEFKGKEYSIEELSTELKKYENIACRPFVIWEEVKRYPETEQLIKDGTLR